MICPGSKILLSSFIQNFRKYETYYRKRMHDFAINNDGFAAIIPLNQLQTLVYTNLATTMVQNGLINLSHFL